MVVDYLIVGAGLTGATIARDLMDAQREVLVVERHSTVGGHVHDSISEHGIPVHTYGPHYFRTSSPRIWEFVNRFSTFRPFKAIVKSSVNGRIYPWPITAECIASLIGPHWRVESHREPSNFEEACLTIMPRQVYETFVRGYTEKQWGVAASSLAAALARRVEVRQGDVPYLSQHKYQGLPSDGYTALIDSLLENIPVLRGWEYAAKGAEIKARKCLIFTGSIDEYFAFAFGKLKYRGQRRVHTWVECGGYAQPVVQINNPDPKAGEHIRTIEWKHMMPKELAAVTRGTILTREYPRTPSEPSSFEYPFPDAENAQLYARYAARAASIPGLLVCGRLGEYKYYDMDQAIGRARVLAAKLLSADKRVTRVKEMCGDLA